MDAYSGATTHQQRADGHRGCHCATARPETALWEATGHPPADRWYGTPEFLRACHELGYSVLIRLKSNRKVYRVPVRRYKREAPPKDGPLLQGTRPETHGQADEEWSEESPEGRRVHISRWNHVHFQQDRELDLAVIRVEREAAKGTKSGSRA